MAADMATLAEPTTNAPDIAAPTELLAADPHDAALLATVHPEGWTNPRAADRYQLVVIGAGSGGLVSAAVAAGLGARVVLVERHLMGGDCLNVGCVPSKAVIRAARAWDAARTAAERFGGPRARGGADFGAAMERMRRLRAELSPADGAARFRDLGVDVFLGDACFVGPDAVAVDGQTLRFRRAIVATGSRPSVPPIDGLEEAGYVTNETVFSLTEPPEHLLLVGGGPIGCELAQAFARLGSRVTLLDAGDRLLAHDDPDAARVVEEALAHDGVAVHHRARVQSARADGAARVLTCEIDGRTEEVAGDLILVATGRTPTVAGMGLERAGVACGEHGIEVDDRLRTTNRRVFAVGDCASKYQFTHAAGTQAVLAVPNALFFGLGGGKASDLVMPWCTYTSPEVAHVGMTAAGVHEAGDRVETITVPLGEVDRAVLDGDTAGFFRVHLARGSDRILGATLVAEDAGNMISEVTVAMTNGLGLEKIGRAIHPYPTTAEAIRKAADAYRRGKLTPGAKRLLGLFFRVFR